MTIRTFGAILAAAAATALCLSAAAGPALAAPVEQPAKADAERKICMTKTGAITSATAEPLDSKQCKTRKQWEAKGYRFSDAAPTTTGGAGERAR